MEGSVAPGLGTWGEGGGGAGTPSGGGTEADEEPAAMVSSRATVLGALPFPLPWPLLFLGAISHVNGNNEHKQMLQISTTTHRDLPNVPCIVHTVLFQARLEGRGE